MDKRRLLDLGLMDRTVGGVQVDCSVVKQRLSGGRLRDARLCNKNCTMELNGVPTGGQYICPAAISLNRRLMPSTLTPAPVIVEGILRTVEGIRLARGELLSNFSVYCTGLLMPVPVRELIKEILSSDLVEVNLFGGLHKETVEIIRLLKKHPLTVSLTITGGQTLRDPDFVENLALNPPDVLALSADDFDGPEQIRRLSTIPLDELQQEWRGIPWFFGQRKKAYEAIHAARMVGMHVGFTTILFNLVIHPGNLPVCLQIMDALWGAFPQAVINPFPVQSAFLYEQPPFGSDCLVLLEQLVDLFIQDHVAPNHKLNGRLTRRLHYWLVLKSAFEVWRDDPSKLVRAIAGYGVWRCYYSPVVSRYTQICASSSPVSDDGHPGGCLGCFWNETVTQNVARVWDEDPEFVCHYLVEGRQTLGRRAGNPCPGCLYPRLMYDSLSTQDGLTRELWPTFLDLRRKYIGF